MDEWKAFEKNNLTISFNVLYIEEKEIYPAYIGKHNSTPEKQIILLMIPKQRKRKMTLSCCKKIICIIAWNNCKNIRVIFIA